MPGQGGASSTVTDVKKDLQEIKPEGEEDEDETFERDAAQLLGSFAEAKEESKEEELNEEELMKQFMDAMRAADRENEVIRVLSAFKLNPFEKLNLRFTATASEVKRQYRCHIASLPFSSSSCSLHCISGSCQTQLAASTHDRGTQARNTADHICHICHNSMRRGSNLHLVGALMHVLPLP